MQAISMEQLRWQIAQAKCLNRILGAENTPSGLKKSFKKQKRENKKK